MTDVDKAHIVKAMTGESSTDVVAAFLAMAGEAVKNYVGSSNDSVLDQYGGVQARIAAYWINKRGADGQLAHSENGISRSYEAGDIPPSLLRELVPKATVIE